MGHGWEHFVGGDCACGKVAQAKAIEACHCEEGGICDAVFEFFQARLHIATELDGLQVRTQAQGLRIAPHR